MSKWKMVKLGDIFEITSGGTPSKTHPEYYENGTIFWVKTGDLKGKYITSTPSLITKAGLKNSSAKIFPVETTLLAMYGATIGACSILKVEAATNQACAAFLPNNDIDTSFFYYFLCSKREQFIKLGVGGAQPNISATILKKIKIHLPPLEEQKRIADILDKASSLIDLRKQQLEKMDLLIKSKFIDMFGDPVTNPKGWEVKQLAEVTNKIGSGSTPRGGKESYIEEGISLIRSMNVHNGRFKYDELAYIDEAQAKQMDIVNVFDSDVLINITGASVARSCVVPKDVLPARVNQHVSIIRCIYEKINPIYLNQLFISDSYKNVLLAIGGAGGATREAITKQQLEKMNIPIPLIELQNKFAAFVEQVEKQKAVMQQSLGKMETKYKALMQQYFR